MISAGKPVVGAAEEKQDDVCELLQSQSRHNARKCSMISKMHLYLQVSMRAYAHKNPSNRSVGSGSDPIKTLSVNLIP